MFIMSYSSFSFCIMQFLSDLSNKLDKFQFNESSKSIARKTFVLGRQHSLYCGRQ